MTLSTAPKLVAWFGYLNASGVYGYRCSATMLEFDGNTAYCRNLGNAGNTQGNASSATFDPSTMVLTVNTESAVNYAGAIIYA